MVAEQTLLVQLDQQIDKLFAGWSIYTTVLSILFLGYLLYPFLVSYQPDTHPLLLARQAAASAVRQPGESAVYRSAEVPHGYPLRSGLNVKDPGSAKWTSGRDGDLRDIWRRVVEGPTPKNEPGKKASILSVKGRGEPAEHKIDELSKDINSMGQYIQSLGARRVAIYLPNSVEFLVALFASSFYEFVPILIPQGQASDHLSNMLRETKADVLIAPAGTISPPDLANSVPALKNFIWVVEETSRHMDWSDSSPNTTQWHDVVEAGSQTSSAELPASVAEAEPTKIVSVWQKKVPWDYEIVEYTQDNLVAAVAAQISALPRTARFESSDVVISLDSLTLMYPLTILLATLFLGGSVILTTSAGPDADYSLAFQGIAPTIVIASTETLSRLHARKMALTNGFLSQFQHSRHAQALAVGTMLKPNTLGNLQGPRLIYTYERAGAETIPMSTAELADLRIVTGARIIYALTAARVTGAVAQTNMYDYRADSSMGNRSHFGPPLSCVEVMLVDTPTSKISNDTDPIGQIVVSGPAVVGGQVNIQVTGRIRDDHTLVLV